MLLIVNKKNEAVRGAEVDFVSYSFIALFSQTHNKQTNKRTSKKKRVAKQPCTGR